MNGVVIQTLQAVSRMLHNLHAFDGRYRGGALQERDQVHRWEALPQGSWHEDFQLRRIDLVHCLQAVGSLDFELDPELCSSLLAKGGGSFGGFQVEQPPKQPLAAISAAATPSFLIRARSSVG